MKAPDGRTVLPWHPRDRKTGIESGVEHLVAAIVSHVELFNYRGTLARLGADGRLINVTPSALRDLIAEKICGVRVVKNGSGWRREFFSFGFDRRPRPAPRAEDFGKPVGPETEPDTTVLDVIHRELPWRVAGVEV